MTIVLEVEGPGRDSPGPPQGSVKAKESPGLELGKGQAQTPRPAALWPGEPDARGQCRADADAVQGDAGSEEMLPCGEPGSEMLVGGRARAVSRQLSEPAPSWDVSAVFAKS